MSVTCDAPTSHFSSGCELLLHYDADKDGLINLDELTQSYTDYESGVITEEEFDFVSDAYIYGGVNAVCFCLVEGVQYVSMPVIPGDPCVDAIFGTSGLTVKRFNTATGFYETATIVVPGEGYRVTCADTKGINVGTGTPSIVSLSDLIAVYNSLSIGQWALVGPGNDSINVIGTVLEGRVSEWNISTGEYEYTNVLEIGKGYWIEGPKEKKTVTFESIPAGATVSVV